MFLRTDFAVDRVETDSNNPAASLVTPPALKLEMGPDQATPLAVTDPAKAYFRPLTATETSRQESKHVAQVMADR
jgi:hypothetical protein